MIETLSRRLRVRDDGTGKGREKDGTFAEFDSEDAIILLGDPGMGKTTLFSAAANANHATVRDFLIDPHAVTGEALFLDALDEYRNLVSGHDASAEVAKALCVLKKPKFRLSCRAADWFGSTDQEAFRTASASGRVVVLELRPLSRDEVLNAVQGVVPDPAQFLDEVESAGLGKLLGNPQTLELMVLAWGTDKKPRNKFEAYEIGVSELLKEMNEKHVLRGVSSSDPCELRKAAGAAASILLLSNSVGLSRVESTDGNGYVRLSIVPYPNRSDLDAVLKRRLFISSKTDRFELIHRTVAEFLAAEDLSKRIGKSLPVDRVMALICGLDGKPVSSLRGLFAWLMCRLQSRAVDYVQRDPYGVATYGDASVLPPNAQNAIWASLRQLRDPWFLTNEDDRGAFRDLANRNTAQIIREFLQDPQTGRHLRIALLEAVANSTEAIGLNAIIRDMVLAKHDDTWLRTTALSAFAKSVQYDWPSLEALDYELAQATDDLTAPEVRVELLLLTRSFGSLPLRMLSIMEQAAGTKKEFRTFGHFYPLINLPSDTDLDVILDNSSRVLRPGTEAHYEFRSLFGRWLKRRLENPMPITPAQMCTWLRNIGGTKRADSEETLASMKVRFAQDSSFFGEVFELLADTVPTEKRSFSPFITYYLWQLLPAAIWPVHPCDFFLAYAERENNPERAAESFRMYLAWFPLEGASIALTEAGFDLLDRRDDIAKELGDWRSCQIADWRTNQSTRHEAETQKRAEEQAQNVAYLTPRLSAIREGGEVPILAWAAEIYGGLVYGIENVPDGRGRLVSLTNDEIADALIEGFIRYAENPAIPKKDDIVKSWHANRFHRTHILLSLSVFLRHSVGMAVPEAALPQCIAAVVTGCAVSNNVPSHNETMSVWLLHEVRHHPDVTESVLYEIWLAGTTKGNDRLPRFYELCHDTDSQQFLASLSAKILMTGINEDHETVGKLVSVLLHHDRCAVLEIGATELARNELSVEVRAIWSTALFVIDPSKYLEPWRTLMSESDAVVLWKAIEVIGGSRYENRGTVSLSSAQRMEIVMALGQRLANVGYPSGVSVGCQNPRDAAEFVAGQIKLLAADGSVEVDAHLERLEHDNGLASYRDLIRHHRAQHEKQQRESSFTFASPERVAQAIMNSVPATPSDLLAFIVDHLGVLSCELTRTQRERYRAYWNHDGKNLVNPKQEEICSGFLAEDLQNRVQAQGLVVVVEHHMIADKECDLVVLQGTERLLPIEVKHHYHRELWTAWRTQLDRLYTRDAKAGGLGIYLVLWSGEAKGGKMPKLPNDLKRPGSATELSSALESLIPEKDRQRLRVVVLDISGP